MKVIQRNANKACPKCDCEYFYDLGPADPVYYDIDTLQCQDCGHQYAWYRLGWG